MLNLLDQKYAKHGSLHRIPDTVSDDLHQHHLQGSRLPFELVPTPSWEPI